MSILIQQIVCSGCKEKISSFYAFTGKCPSCGFLFSSTKQSTYNSGVRQLRKEKKEYLKNTLTKAQVKSLFKLNEEQIAKIPVTTEFGQERYTKIDVFKAIQNNNLKSSSG